ncbi:MAG: hypothetical protein ACRYF3_11760 [Janthinobacterium lividum]
MDWPDIADELYALAPAHFTPTRDERASQARAAGDRDLAVRIASLRKPPTAAWAVNQLVRDRGAEVEQLLQLGAAMREATTALAGPQLRELAVRQHQVLDAMRVQAQRLAGEKGVRVSPDVGEQIVATLRAGMSDPAAADAVRSGRLVRPLEATGFGDVEIDDAVAGNAAAPTTPRTVRTAPLPAGQRGTARPQAAPDELRARREDKAAREAARRVAQEERRAAEDARRERERRDHEEALDRAREEAVDARRDAGTAALDLASLGRRADDLARRQADLAAQLEVVTDQLESARGGVRAAERAAHGADERLARADRELQRLEAPG